MNNVTAKNYSAQVCKSIPDFYERVMNCGHPERENDLKKLQIILSLIEKKAIHFAVPDGGKFLEKSGEFKALRGTELKLPYPIITVECYTPLPEDGGLSIRLEKNLNHDDLIWATKRLVLAYEGPSIDEEDELGIYIYPFHSNEKGDRWYPGPLAFFIYSDWEAKDEDGNFIRAFTGRTVPFQEWIVEEYRERYEEINISMEELNEDLTGSTLPLMNMLEALACNNVSHIPIEKIDKNKNEKRIKKGKVPFHETRVLVVNTRSKTCSLGNNSGGHKSPRIHLRRGHIRRISEERRVWVNCCVVGSKGEGLLNKSYRVE